METEPVKRWNEKRQGGRGAKKNLERRGKVIRYQNASEEVQRGLEASRVQEWNKWAKYKAADVITKEEADQLIADGAEHKAPSGWKSIRITT